ncbi:LysM peptidoglycan-binding domain-containing protein [Paracoccus pacificus]|uniref:LysM peptidoglycan-binding domain-containing protein n=1 Tax=Paracoccus pacificus TaxID=1463598 RepID=A0ABW4R9Q6_9RHOB
MAFPLSRARKTLTVLGGASVLLLAACNANGTFDPDLRGFGRGGLETATAASTAVPRAAPDQRGVISYPGYQVAVARNGDTVSSIAARLGLNAGQLASYNAIDANAPLNPGAIVALPTRVAAGAPAGNTSGTGLVRDPFAGQTGATTPTAGSAGTGTVSSTTLPPSSGGASAQPAATATPKQHRVAAGETAWSIARTYNVNVNDLASWNGLSTDMSLRTGQMLMIPIAGAKPPASTTVSAPGAGSPTPTPPSASDPLPKEKTEPASKPVDKSAAPDLGKTRTAASGSGRFRMPVNGSIIRTYSKGKNEGIDISAAPGASVAAAGSGTVAAITKDVNGVPIVVVRHDGGLLTVYQGLETVAVKKGQSVSSGASLGKAQSKGVVHFEVRKGFDSVDPEKYLN